MKKVIVKKKRYVDSVSLMGVAERVMMLKGVENIETHMATPANLLITDMMGYEVPQDVTPNDLLIAVTAVDEAVCAAAVALAEDVIDHKAGDDVQRYCDLRELPRQEGGYQLCQISLPGEYVAREAEKALELGMDLFIFSDNVPLEQELELKKKGQAQGRLVMGPDAGVALIGGVALAAGSIIKDGPIGIVAASGSGAQEIGCIIEKCGLGVSSLIGTGGRDLYPEIGGITMMEGIRRMESDEYTKVIVLVSKLADLQVMENILSFADTCRKPVVAVFLGGTEALFAGHRVRGTYSLEECALEAVKLAGGSVENFGYTDEERETMVSQAVARLEPSRTFFRGLYCGGTFAEEALQYFSRHNAGTRFHSNLRNGYCELLTDPEVSQGHAILDLGAENFTEKAPHPVFDPQLRLKRLKQELSDPEVAVILLDFITGPGVARDPITAFAQVCAEHREVIFISNICGSQEDPQNVEEKARLLKQAGVLVTESNYESTRLASEIMLALERR